MPKIQKELLKPNILSCKKTYWRTEKDLSIYRIVLSQWIDFYNEKEAVLYITTNNIKKAKKELLQAKDIFNIKKREFIY